MTRDTTFLERFDTVSRGSQPSRVGVKDLFDVAGTITTAGSLAIESIATAALHDAPCLLGLRAAEQESRAVLVGKLNLHELAYGGDGMNPHFGTPPNPLDPLRVPGGSSSASASAVGRDLLDIAFGSDTGGSIRIPAACCGVVGLKTTWGRIALDGVWALAPSLDTAGPLGATVTRTIEGMDLFEPGFRLDVNNTQPAMTVGRLRNTGVDTHPACDDAVDSALKAGGFTIVDLDAPWWQAAIDHGLTALVGEAHNQLGWLLDDTCGLAQLLEPRIANRIASGAKYSQAAIVESIAYRSVIAKQIHEACRQTQLIVTPTLAMLAPVLGESAVFAPYTAYTRPANLAGTPAVSIPVPLDPSLVSSKERHLVGALQLMGPAGSDALLMSTALVIESAVV